MKTIHLGAAVDKVSFKQWLLAEMAQVQKVSPDLVREKGLFGPLYHGTTVEKRDLIEKEGFKFFKGVGYWGTRGVDRSYDDNISNGYSFTPYSQLINIPPPIHHLGFGIYFTKSITIGKKYNQGSVKGLKPYYLKSNKIETINWGASNTMMKWWKTNGYNMPSFSEMKEDPKLQDGKSKMSRWIQETDNLTKTLSSKFDAVWYKGKGMSSLLDGDQVCVYDVDNVVEIDNSLSPKLRARKDTYIGIGDRFKILGVPAAGVALSFHVGGNDDWRYVVWSKLLRPNHFDYLMTVKLDRKTMLAIKEIYYEGMVKVLIDEVRVNPIFSALVERAKEVFPQGDPVEEVAKNQTVRLFGDLLQSQFPSGLVEKVLKPREKIS